MYNLILKKSGHKPFVYSRGANEEQEVVEHMENTFQQQPVLWAVAGVDYWRIMPHWATDMSQKEDQVLMEAFVMVVVVVEADSGKSTTAAAEPPLSDVASDW